MLDTDKIKSLRLARRLTTKEAAEAAGFNSPQEWGRLERDKPEGVSISLRTLARVAEALHTRPGNLLRREEP